MAPDPVCITIDDSEGEEDPMAHLEAASTALTSTGLASTPNSGPSSSRSPLVRQEGTSSKGQSSREAGTARQLYQGDCFVDEAATAAHQEALSRTGKALQADNNSIKPEEGGPDPAQREPLDEDIAQLEAELLRNPRLQGQLERGEGSSSNPQHLWRLRVFQALLQHQEQLLTQAQQQQQGSTVIEDSEPEDEDVDSDDKYQLQPKKKQKTMPQPAAKAAAATGGGAAGGAGSSRQADPKQRQRAQQQADQLQGEDGDGSLSGGPAAAVGGQQQQPRQPQPQQPPRPRQRTQPRGNRNNAAAAGSNGAGAAPAAAAADGGGGGGAAPNAAEQRVAQRQLRAQLSRVAADMAARHDDLTDSRSSKLPVLLYKLQELGDRAKRPREAAQHAGVMADAMQAGLDMIQDFKRERGGRNPPQLLAALRRFCPADPAAAARSSGEGPVRLDWQLLGGVVESAGLFRTAPGVGSMLGALAGEAKARKVAVRQVRAPVEPEVRPVVGAAALRDDGERQQTDRVLTDMRRVMARVGRCSVVRLVLDHESFAHTVENMFTLSFLCKDMFCSLEEDNENGLMVQHISMERQAQLKREHEAATAAGAAGRLNPHQFMMQLDMDVWRDMRAVVQRGDTLMPQRPRTTHH